MNRQELADALYRQMKEKNQKITRPMAEEAVAILFDTMQQSLLSGDNIRVRGFGSLRVTERNRRCCRNPWTGDTVVVEAHKTVTFKPGKDLKAF